MSDFDISKHEFSDDDLMVNGGSTTADAIWVNDQACYPFVFIKNKTLLQ